MRIKYYVIKLVFNGTNPLTVIADDQLHLQLMSKKILIH
jgi:hypothetical protein